MRKGIVKMKVKVIDIAISLTKGNFKEEKREYNLHSTNEMKK